MYLGSEYEYLTIGCAARCRITSGENSKMDFFNFYNGAQICGVVGIHKVEEQDLEGIMVI